MSNSVKISRIVLFGAFVGLTPSVSKTQTNLKCRAANEHSANMISEITRYVTATDARTIFNRDSVMHLPVVSSSQISLVTDERICAKAVQAYIGLPTPYTPPSLYVIKLGTKGYVTHDPDRKVGEFSVVFVFNTKFVRTGGWGSG